MENFLKVDGKWVPTLAIKVKTNGVWTNCSEADFRNFINGRTISFSEYIDGTHTLTVVGTQSITGETYSFSALYDNRSIVTSACTWSVVSGGSYATVDSAGTLTILTGATGVNVIVSAEYSGVTGSDTIAVTYREGTTASTETEVVTDESGNITTTTTTLIENDGIPR